MGHSSGNQVHDDEQLYGTSDAAATGRTGNTGIISGEGSHLGKSRESEASAPVGGSSTLPGSFPQSGTTESQDLSSHPVGGSLAGNKGIGHGGGELTGRSVAVFIWRMLSLPLLTSENRSTHADPAIPSSTTTSGIDTRSGNITGSHVSNLGRGAGLEQPIQTSGDPRLPLGGETGALQTGGVAGKTSQPHQPNQGSASLTPGQDNRQQGGEYVGTSHGAVTTSGTQGSGASAINTNDRKDIGGPAYSGSNTIPESNHHLGRDAAAVGTAGAVGEGIHRHRENEREDAHGSSLHHTGPSISRGVGDISGVSFLP